MSLAVKIIFAAEIIVADPASLPPPYVYRIPFDQTAAGFPYEVPENIRGDARLIS